MVSKSKIVTDGDPLAYVLAPPPNESEEQRQTRLAAEAEAKRISDAIDEELQRQAKAEKRGPKPIKILLLGESLIRRSPVVVVGYADSRSSSDVQVRASLVCVPFFWWCRLRRASVLTCREGKSTTLKSECFPPAGFGSFCV